MPPNLGLKGRLARMFLDFLDEHGDYRTQLEEAAARAAAASASSLLAKDREGRKKKRRRGRFGLGGEEYDDEDDEELEMLEERPPVDPKNQLPEDPYEQIQFYIRTFRQRTTEQFHEQVELKKLQVQTWMHDELHHPMRVPALSLLILLLCAVMLGWRKRRAKFQKVQRIHGILGKKFVASIYLHPQFLRGRIMGEFSATGQIELEKLKAKANKAEEAALASMRPYQRKKYERLQKLEKIGDRIVTVWLMVGMAASACCAVISVGRLYGYFSDQYGNNVMDTETEQLDGYIYSIDGPTDNDGYPESIKNLAEENYAQCLSDAEARGVENPTTVCNVDAFFDEAAAQQQQYQYRKVPLPPLLNSTRLSPTLSTYLATLPTQTIAYLSSLFSFSLFLLTNYVSHKIHVAAMQNDPMKHFVATATDSTIKADGTVEAKKGETEAQRKRRERMLLQERYKAQMAQLAMEAKQRVQERRRRLELEEGVKKEQEEAEVKQKVEMDETVKMHSRQFMMLKAGVPDGAILNSFLPEGIEEDEGREILEKLKAIKIKRAEEARKAEEEAEAKQKKQEEEDRDKERVAAERLRLMKMGSVGSNIAKKPAPQAMHRTHSQPALVRKNTNGSVAASVNTDSTPQFSRASLHKSLPTVSTAGVSITRKEGTSSPTTSSVATASTAKSSKREDPSIAKGKMLGDIGKVNLSSLHKTNKTVAHVGVKAISPEESDSLKVYVDSAPLGTQKVWDKESKSWVSMTPQKSNVTSSVKPNVITSKDNVVEEEKKGDDSVTKQVSGLTSADDIDLDEIPTPPLLTHVSSPSDFVPETNLIESFETPSGWGCRLSAADIQAQIEAVENGEEEETDEEESIEHEAHDLNLGPNAFHSPGFDQALRNSNASWDRRPSSRDIMARIKEAEEFEARSGELEEDQKRAAMIRSRSANRLRGEELAIISEDHNIEPTTSFEIRRKARLADDDSEVSELSMTTYEENPLDLSRGRAIPKALFLRQDSGNAKIPFSPALTASPGVGFLNSKAIQNERAQEMLRMAEKGELNLPPLPVVMDTPSASNIKGLEESSITVKSDNASSKNPKTANSVDGSDVKEETEEEKLRRERAEKRARKMEEMAAKRNTGGDDGTSVSGLSKLRRRRKKMAQNDESAAVQSNEMIKEEPPKVAEREETEEERLRRERAEKRARKMEEMAAKRNAGKDDSTAVSGISKHHRMRRKKSALAANAEEQAKVDWSNSIFQTVLNAEQARWQRTIYSHVLNAEQTRESNIETKRVIEEMDERAQRIRDNQKNLETRAKKFAAKAERFHKLREGGGVNQEDGSVSNAASRMRRRRSTRKSTSKPMSASVKDTLQIEPALTEEVPQDDEGSNWCKQVYKNVLSSDQNKWKKSVYNHVLDSEKSHALRMEMEALVESQRSLAEARLEKERQNEHVKLSRMKFMKSSKSDKYTVSTSRKHSNKLLRLEASQRILQEHEEYKIRKAIFDSSKPIGDEEALRDSSYDDDDGDDDDSDHGYFHHVPYDPLHFEPDEPTSHIQFLYENLNRDEVHAKYMPTLDNLSSSS